MYIRGRGKIGYLTGETKAHEKTNSTYATWDAENSMIMSWLVNAMEEEISANYMCYPIAKELWDNVSQMYSDLGNQSQIYKLQLKLGDIRQGESSVTGARIFKFLVGLNVEFDEVRGWIIGRQPLPSISEVFSKVRREESRQSVMLGKKESGGPVESSALASATVANRPYNN
ncbi:hypothetical protein EZV62_024612 [Acer yangbiense]|uniref:Retrotransposon Copia-like N-terminal domain-containing protein n=1 Tax=Acer yangbiense TaxID=1000413 RepID=A0A5C7GW58_9ROSI|nr:hypothetical protein EZV62_024612 [Acer yangbiense]